VKVSVVHNRYFSSFKKWVWFCNLLWKTLYFHSRYHLRSHLKCGLWVSTVKTTLISQQINYSFFLMFAAPAAPSQNDHIVWNQSCARIKRQKYLQKSVFSNSKKSENLLPATKMLLLILQPQIWFKSREAKKGSKTKFVEIWMNSFDFVEFFNFLKRVKWWF